MSGHFKTVCRACKTVVSQCRCPSKDKTVSYVESCSACPKKDKTVSYKTLEFYVLFNTDSPDGLKRYVRTITAESIEDAEKRVHDIIRRDMPSMAARDFLVTVLDIGELVPFGDFEKLVL